jgi:hypothetical protein
MNLSKAFGKQLVPILVWSAVYEVAKVLLWPLTSAVYRVGEAEVKKITNRSEKSLPLSERPVPVSGRPPNELRSSESPQIPAAGDQTQPPQLKPRRSSRRSSGTADAV